MSKVYSGPEHRAKKLAPHDHYHLAADDGFELKPETQQELHDGEILLARFDQRPGVSYELGFTTLGLRLLGEGQLIEYNNISAVLCPRDKASDILEVQAGNTVHRISCWSPFSVHGFLKWTLMDLAKAKGEEPKFVGGLWD